MHSPFPDTTPLGAHSLDELADLLGQSSEETLVLLRDLGVSWPLVGGRSALNVDGTPLQIRRSTSRAGTTTHLVADPATSDPLLLRAWRALGLVQARVRRLAVPDTVKADFERALRSALPPTEALRDELPNGCLWVCICTKPRIESAFVNMSFGRPESRWPRIERWLAELGVEPSGLPHDSSGEVPLDAAAVGVEAGEGRPARVFVYGRVRDIRTWRGNCEESSSTAFDAFVHTMLGPDPQEIRGLLFARSFELGTGRWRSSKWTIRTQGEERSDWQLALADLHALCGLEGRATDRFLRLAHWSLAAVSLGVDGDGSRSIHTYHRPVGVALGVRLPVR